MRKEIAPTSRDLFVRGMEGHSAVLSIRPVGDDVYIIQTTEPPVNERIMDLLITVDAVKRAGAKK